MLLPISKYTLYLQQTIFLVAQLGQIFQTIEQQTLRSRRMVIYIIP